VTKEEILEWEGRNRPRAGIAAIVAAVLGLGGAIVSTLALAKLPDAEDKALTTITTLGNAVNGTANPPGRLSIQAAYLGEHATIPIIGSLLIALGTFAIFPAMAVLFRATRARRAQTPPIGLVLLAVGTVFYGVGRAVADIARYTAVSGFGHASDQTNKHAADLLSNSTSGIGEVFNMLGALVLAAAFIVICLNAMRCGLLPRFLGVLGIIVGITFVPILPLDRLGILRAFWLVALGALLLERWPRGMPPAWAAGEAVPWPTQQELREEREAQVAQERRAEPAPSAPAPRAPAAASSHSSSKKKKRKRRA
jgi:hypothetical protein